MNKKILLTISTIIFVLLVANIFAINTPQRTARTISVDEVTNQRINRDMSARESVDIYLVEDFDDLNNRSRRTQGVISSSRSLENINIERNDGCVIDESLNQEVNNLMNQLRRLSYNDDKAVVNEYREKINYLRNEINNQLRECKKTFKVVEAPVVSPKSETRTQFIPCDELENVRLKYNDYLKLLELDESSLIEKGYPNKERIKEILIILKYDYIARLELRCNISNESEVAYEETDDYETLIDSEKKIIPKSANKIGEYYRERITDTIISEIEDEDKINELKEIRKVTNLMIGDLINSEHRIEFDEISDLVENIRISPGNIKIDDVNINTLNRSFSTRIKDREIRLIPNEREVLIEEDNLNGRPTKIRTSNVNLESGELRIGNSAIEISANEIIESLNMKEILDIELFEDKGRIVYDLKYESEGKFLGLIPVTFKERSKFNGENTEVELINTKSPLLKILISR
jgi:hypothetical protein